MPKSVITIHHLPNSAIHAQFHGNFDEDTIDHSAPHLASALEKESKPNLILDFTSLDYINSRGIGEMSTWFTTVTQKGGQVIFFGANETIRDILEVVSFDDLFEEAKDLPDAQKRLTD